MKKESREYQLIVVNPNRCVDCEKCMSICSFVHDSEYLPLSKRILGMRTRIELEWAISCDLCSEINMDYIDPKSEGKPQCIEVCANRAIFITTIEPYGEESKIEAIRRIFSQKCEI